MIINEHSKINWYYYKCTLYGKGRKATMSTSQTTTASSCSTPAPP